MENISIAFQLIVSISVLIVWIFRYDNIVVEFKDYDTAIKCYESNEYQEAHDILNDHVIRHHQIVEGS